MRGEGLGRGADVKSKENLEMKRKINVFSERGRKRGVLTVKVGNPTV